MIRVGGDFRYSPPVEEGLKDLLLIGGGVGINPLFSMLLHHIWLLSAHPDHTHQAKRGRVRLLYSSKTKDELLFKVRGSTTSCHLIRTPRFLFRTRWIALHLKQTGSKFNISSRLKTAVIPVSKVNKKQPIIKWP